MYELYLKVHGVGHVGEYIQSGTFDTKWAAVSASNTLACTVYKGKTVAYWVTHVTKNATCRGTWAKVA